MAVMQAESGCRANIDNAGLNVDGSVDYGLMQINSIHADMVAGNLESLRNPEVNVRVAYSIYSAHSWSAWNAFTNQSYLKYLK